MESNSEKIMRRDLRRYFSTVGWALLLYFALMNFSVLFVQFVEIILALWKQVLHSDSGSAAGIFDGFYQGIWGYFLAAGIGIVILLAWKKTAYWKKVIWARGRNMKTADFFGLACALISAQVFFQVYSYLFEAILNVFGFSEIEGFIEMSEDIGGFAMFLYSGMLAPIAEEILFRGLIQKTLVPYGKRFAVLGSSILFGLFHGNIIQAPYAFVCGLILGYTAAEYSIGWAMLLHMINNLVLADLLGRVTAGLPEEISSSVYFAVILLCAVAACIILLVRRREVRAYKEQNPIPSECVRCFFTSAGIITFSVLMIISIVLTFFVCLIRI